MFSIQIKYELNTILSSINQKIFFEIFFFTNSDITNPKTLINRISWTRKIAEMIVHGIYFRIEIESDRNEVE